MSVKAVSPRFAWTTSSRASPPKPAMPSPLSTEPAASDATNVPWPFDVADVARSAPTTLHVVGRLRREVGRGQVGAGVDDRDRDARPPRAARRRAPRPRASPRTATRRRRRRRGGGERRLAGRGARRDRLDVADPGPRAERAAKRAASPRGRHLGHAQRRQPADDRAPDAPRARARARRASRSRRRRSPPARARGSDASPAAHASAATDRRKPPSHRPPSRRVGRRHRSVARTKEPSGPILRPRGEARHTLTGHGGRAEGTSGGDRRPRRRRAAAAGRTSRPGCPCSTTCSALLAARARFDLVARGRARTRSRPRLAAAGRAIGEALAQPLRAEGARGPRLRRRPGRGGARAPSRSRSPTAPLVVSNVDLSRERVGGLEGDVVARFLREFAEARGPDVHVRLIDGHDRSTCWRRSSRRSASRSAPRAARPKEEQMASKTVVRTEAAPAPFQGAPVLAGDPRRRASSSSPGQLALRPGRHGARRAARSPSRPSRCSPNLRAILEEAGQRPRPARQDDRLPAGPRRLRRR